ncbi:Uma2 family endonuclease [Actinomadura craniellae]|uniref:Uma2 family endonuclease n=1 Tax=Actinomadura craniellae TaxID=2231787 RepID=A0A365GWU3_9ACTN|nr:Uma2 family endonuclease [Actinomadura craniellae]RAY11295.1 Uma2 family endonuclease [Actinomadura craniellae]
MRYRKNPTVPAMALPLPSGDTWTRADYAALPEDLPVRVSLIHGELIVRPRPHPIHQRIARRLATRIEEAALDTWQVDTDVDVLVDDDEVEPVEIAPDIVVYSTEHDVYERPIPAALVTLVVEVVSPSTKRKDRRVRPVLYAEAGIRHYWQVETDQTAPAFAIYTYELDDATDSYVPTGVHHDRITTPLSLALDIDLKAVRNR